MHRVLRWDVPVDDQWHEIGGGPVVHCAARDHRSTPGDLVEVWTLEETPPDGGTTINVPTIRATVVGTGHAVPEATYHVGTAVVPTFTAISRLRDTDEQIVSMAGLVWHVFAKHDEAYRDRLAEEGRRLASIREDLIAQGVDPNELPVPLHPDPLPPVGDRTNAWPATVPCPDCGHDQVMGYAMRNDAGEQVHTHYVCTFYSVHERKACGWHDWSVPGWNDPES